MSTRPGARPAMEGRGDGGALRRRDVGGMSRRRETGRSPVPVGAEAGAVRNLRRTALSVGVAVGAAGCVPWVSPVTFDTAEVRVHDDGDFATLQVKVAETEDQQARGLRGRSELAPDSGMLFLFDTIRADTAGFWMWETEIPLDIAFMDREGVIVEVLSMDPCEHPDPDDCPVYAPGVEYWSALEVAEGWFDRHGLGPGARVEVIRRPSDASREGSGGIPAPGEPRLRVAGSGPGPASGRET